MNHPDDMQIRFLVPCKVSGQGKAENENFYNLDMDFFGKENTILTVLQQSMLGICLWYRYEQADIFVKKIYRSLGAGIIDSEGSHR